MIFILPATDNYSKHENGKIRKVSELDAIAGRRLTTYNHFTSWKFKPGLFSNSIDFFRPYKFGNR